MTVPGTFETWLVWLTMSASGGKAEVRISGPSGPSLTQLRRQA
jgi:hypothetical protein